MIYYHEKEITKDKRITDMKNKIIKLALAFLALCCIVSFAACESQDACEHANLTHTEFIAPTCYEDGVRESWACSDCGKIFSDKACTKRLKITVIRKKNHLNAVAVESHEADCTHDEVLPHVYCPDCDKYFSDKTFSEELEKDSVVLSPKLNHAAAVKVAAVGATCTKDGNIEHWYCGACDRYFSDGELTQEVEQTEVVLPKINHANAVHTAFKAETCSADGVRENWYCGDCGKYFAGNEFTAEVDPVIPAAHKYGDFVYDFEELKYVKTCAADSSHVIENSAGSEEFPYLIRNEEEFQNLTENYGGYFKLADEIDSIDITTAGFNYVYTLTENSVVDLNAKTLNVKNHAGFVIEGKSVTIRNGTVTLLPGSGGSYSIFVGDMSDNNDVTIENISSNAGFNCYNTQVTLTDCEVDNSAYKYYAVWADPNAHVTINGGEYRGGSYGYCLKSDGVDLGNNAWYSSSITVESGKFYGKVGDERGLIAIKGGEFIDSNIASVARPYYVIESFEDIITACGNEAEYIITNKTESLKVTADAEIDLHGATLELSQLIIDGVSNFKIKNGTIIGNSADGVIVSVDTVVLENLTVKNKYDDSTQIY